MFLKGTSAGLTFKLFIYTVVTLVLNAFYVSIHEQLKTQTLKELFNAYHGVTKVTQNF